MAKYGGMVLFIDTLEIVPMQFLLRDGGALSAISYFNIDLLVFGEDFKIHALEFIPLF
ncbi:MAG: hypothetical protein HQK52_16960 [Oligoflexia bacterium]|nr:hypothetical protein [Oligoflexia bacterium]